ncbi:MAG: dihydroorotase [Marinicella sp.]
MTNQSNPSKTLIKNAIVVNEYQNIEADVLIAGERIEKIASHIDAAEGMHVVDAQGLHLLPGMIDDQVHFRDPGGEHKADFGTESAAAVAGGITSVMDMPNTNPLTITQSAIEDKHASISGRSHCNYGFYFGATNDNIEEIKAIDTSLICGIKAFMGASTGNMLVDNENTLNEIFKHAPVLVATHCEDTPIILANEAKAKEQYGENIPVALHPYIRSVKACLKSTELATSLAIKHNARLHVLHISTGAEIKYLAELKAKHSNITAEACVHFLWFSEEDYAKQGALIKCNPAVKTKEDQDTILAGIQDKTIDVIATDHAPHLLAEKSQPYMQSPSGLPLVQTALPSLLTLAQQGKLSLHQTIDQISHRVADMFAVVDRGYIREGYFADLVLVDMNKTHKIDNKNMLYKCGWTPYHDAHFTASIEKTWVNGDLKWSDGKVQNQAHGQALKYNRN